MKKISIIIIVVIILIGVAVALSNPELFKGQLIGSNPSPEAQNQEEQTPNTTETVSKPDLVPDMQINIPEDPQNDLEVSATIRNVGAGALTGKVPFVYSIYMNGALVFSNTDSYTTMEPGDEFSFVYPISRAIYPDNSGSITFKVDTEKAIDEESEDNNEIIKEFSF